MPRLVMIAAAGDATERDPGDEGGAERDQWVLLDLLAEDAESGKAATRPQLAEMTDPARYLGLAGEMVDRVLAIEAKMNR